MSNPIEVREIKKTCRMSPAQWEGVTTDGCPVYCRYRWGVLSVQVGGAGMPLESALRSDPLLCKEVGHEYHGEMTYQELRSHAEHILSLPLRESES